MKAKEFLYICELKGCDGIVIVNDIKEAFTHGNIIDYIHQERVFGSEHTFHDFEALYGFDREILGLGVSDWNGCEGVYIKMKLKGVSSDYDVDSGHFIVTVDDKKYISYLHEKYEKHEYFKLIESEVIRNENHETG